MINKELTNGRMKLLIAALITIPLLVISSGIALGYAGMTQVAVPPYIYLILNQQKTEHQQLTNITNSVHSLQSQVDIIKHQQILALKCIKNPTSCIYH